MGKEGGTGSSPAPGSGEQDLSARERVIAAGVLALTTALVWVGFAPGHMGVDTLGEIAGVDSGDFTNRHAPLLEALWRPFYELGIGPGVVLLGQISTFLAGGYLVLRANLRRVSAALIAAAIALSPPVLGMLGSLTRDTWFAAFLLLGFGLAVRLAQREPVNRGRWAIAIVLVVALALASRQNAAAAVAPLGVLLAHQLLGARPRDRAGLVARMSSRRPLVAAAAVAILAITALVAAQFLATRAIGARDVNPEQYLYIYDLAAASEREDENLFPPAVLPEGGLAAVESGWEVDSMVFLNFGDSPAIASPLEPEPMRALRDAWWDELSSDPLGYLETRTRLFLHQLSIGTPPTTVLPPGIPANEWGYDIWFPAANDLALDYLSPFLNERREFLVYELDGGPLYTVWLYLLIAAGAAVVLLRRGRAAVEIAVGALALSALTLQAGLFLGAMGTAYRFEFPAVAAALFAAPVAIAVLRRAR